MEPRSFHVAMIMDGNGRWATERGLSRSAGHRAGAHAVRRVIEAAPREGIDLLTLYAFSSDNWNRPRVEVDALMTLFQRFLLEETAHCVQSGVHLNVIGRRDRLSPTLVRLVDAAEAATANCSRVRVRLAIDYSSRHAMARASCVHCPEENFRQRLTSAIHADTIIEDVDLLVRTGREKRLSDFLLFEAAYAELHFSDKLWPDFSGDDLRAAVADFRSRDRRFGAIPAMAGAQDGRR